MDIAVNIPRHVGLEFRTDTVDFMVTRPFSCVVSKTADLLDPDRVLHNIRVPEGFVTDLASIPAPAYALNIFSPFLPNEGAGKVGRHLVAAVVHDYLYRTGKLDRERADEIFLAAMKELGVSNIRQQAFYWAVRMGGWASYNKGTP